MHRFAGQHNCKMGQELHETDEQVEIGPVHWQCDVFVCLTSAARVTRFMGSRQAKVASSLEPKRSKQCVSVGFAWVKWNEPSRLLSLYLSLYLVRCALSVPGIGWPSPVYGSGGATVLLPLNATWRRYLLPLRSFALKHIVCASCKTVNTIITAANYYRYWNWLWNCYWCFCYFWCRFFAEAGPCWKTDGSESWHTRKDTLNFTKTSHFSFASSFQVVGDSFFLGQKIP